MRTLSWPQLDVSGRPGFLIRVPLDRSAEIVTGSAEMPGLPRQAAAAAALRLRAAAQKSKTE